MVKKERRLVFTVTTGRSGTAQLAYLFQGEPGIAAVHEPRPEFVEVMRVAINDPDVGRKFWERKKLPAILSYSDRTYLETSHLFCKGFAEPLLELGVVPDIIFLHRSARAVASSMFQLHTIPGRTEEGRRWYISPEDRVFLELPNWRLYTDYQLCYWYCLEISARSSYYKNLFREAGSNVFELETDAMNNYREHIRVCRFLGINWVSVRTLVRFRRRRKIRSNRKYGVKKEQSKTAGLELDRLEAGVQKNVVMKSDG